MAEKDFAVTTTLADGEEPNNASRQHGQEDTIADGFDQQVFDVSFNAPFA